MISVAPKARIRKNCRDVISEMYIRCRLIGSWAVWFWLARIMRGKSQQVRTSRGVESGSVAIYGFKKDHPVSDRFFSQVRLINAIIRLWRRVEGHSHLVGTMQAVGISIRVGMRTFSIVGGLDFVSGQCRGFEQWLLVGQVLRLLRRLRRPVEEQERQRS